MIGPLRQAGDAAMTSIDESWGRLTWLASGAIGNVEGLTLGRVTIRRGEHNPRHCHRWCEETLYLMRGRLSHSLDDERHLMGPGDTLAIPPGVFHHAESIGDEDADMIVAYSSAQRDFVLEAETD